MTPLANNSDPVLSLPDNNPISLPIKPIKLFSFLSLSARGFHSVFLFLLLVFPLASSPTSAINLDVIFTSNPKTVVGLLSLSGLIMFISIFKSELYHKLRPEASTKDAMFTFNYGQSFILYVIGFVVVELSGILNVCLFNKLQKDAQRNQVSQTRTFQARESRTFESITNKRIRRIEI